MSQLTSQSSSHVVSGPPGGRYFWIDVAKTIGIFLIVFGHLGQNAFTDAFLWTFHVPLFFFISGFLTKPHTDKEFLGNLTRKLVLPYIYIYTVNVLLSASLGSDYGVHSILLALAGVIYGTHSYPYFVNAALWFLPSLITIEVLYALCIKRFPLSYLVLLALSYAIYRQHYLNLFFSIDLSLLGLNFFLAGVLTRRFDAFHYLMASEVRLAVITVLCLLCTSAAAYVGNVWYAGEHYVLSIGAGLAGILMVVSASMLLASLLAGKRYAQSFFTFISSNTLFIMCFHMFSNGYASALLEPIGLGPPLSRGLVTAAVSVALLVPFNLLVLRFAPELIGLRRPRKSREPA